MDFIQSLLFVESMFIVVPLAALASKERSVIPCSSRGILVLNGIVYCPLVFLLALFAWTYLLNPLAHDLGMPTFLLLLSGPYFLLATAIMACIDAIWLLRHFEQTKPPVG